MVDDNTAFIVGGLVVEKVRNDVLFNYVGCAYCKKRMIVDDHGNLRCVNGNLSEYASSSRPRVLRSIWLTSFDQCMAGLCKKTFL